MSRSNAGALKKTAGHAGFGGFPEECFEFLAALERHNNREWFHGMREPCETWVLLPARSFVEALGLELRNVYPLIVFDPSTNGAGSMFRLARDTRFSTNKSPYKTNLGFRFWLSPEARRAKRVGLYVHLDKSGVRVYGGTHRLMPEDLAAFREHVALERHAATLRRILADLENQGYELEAERLARVPRGYAASHAGADLLVVKSLFAVSPRIDRSVAVKPGLVDKCAAHAEALKPLNDWFSEALPLPAPTSP